MHFSRIILLNVQFLYGYYRASDSCLMLDYVRVINLRIIIIIIIISLR